MPENHLNVETHNIICAESRQVAGYKILRPTGTPNVLLIFTAGGTGKIRTKNREFATSQGELTIWSQGAYQEYACDSQWHQLWAHFIPRPHWNRLLTFSRTQDGVATIKLDDPLVIENAFRGVLSEAKGRSDWAGEKALVALEKLLIEVQEQRDRRGHPAVDPRIESAINFMVQQIHLPLSVEDIANQVDLSPSRFSHLFRETTGVPPLQWLEQTRMSRARSFLSMSSLSVQAIASDLGFSSPFYFSLRFKRATGLSPSAYRSRHLRS